MKNRPKRDKTLVAIPELGVRVDKEVDGSYKFVGGHNAFKAYRTEICEVLGFRRQAVGRRRYGNKEGVPVRHHAVHREGVAR